jgi:hypothetical protein
MADTGGCRYHCPNCDSELEQEGFILVDAAKDAAEVEGILNGQLNLAPCPNCNTINRIPLPLLYHDFAHELLICYVPGASQLSSEEINGAIEFPYGNVISRVADELHIELPLPTPESLPRNEEGEVTPFATMTAEEAAKILPGYLLRPTIVDGFEIVQAVAQAIQDGLPTQTIIEDMARLQLINALLNTDDPIARRKIMHHNEPMLGEELYEVLDTLAEQMLGDGNTEMNTRLSRVHRDVESYKQAQRERLAKSKAKKNDAQQPSDVS